MRTSCSSSAVIAFAILTFTLLVARSARASTPEDEPPLGSLLGARHEERDLGGSPLWLAVDVQASHRSGSKDALSGMVLLGIPLDRVGKRGSIAEGGALKPPLVPRKTDEKEEPATKAPTSSTDTASPVVLPVAVSPDVARGAVNAALRRAHLLDADAKIDDLQTRARASALLPELRVRVARRVDEGQNVAPTEYDPLRTTSSDVTTLLLEGRATWRLDRLAFADDEIALERIRAERLEARLHLTTRVLSELFAWQRARAQLEEPNASPEERLTAALKILETEATLDVLTDGWFTKWRVGTPAAPIATTADPAKPKAEPPAAAAKLR